MLGEKIDGVSVYLITSANLKCGADFRSFKDPEYHTGPSIDFNSTTN